MYITCHFLFRSKEKSEKHYCNVRICDAIWENPPHGENLTFEFLVPFKSFKGTNGRQKTYEIFHVYYIFSSSFMCQTTVIFGIMKDGSLIFNTLAP